MKPETERASSGRTWPLPRHPWGMRMTWSDLLFAHWPIDPDKVASILPQGVTLDTRDGKAWVGVVPFLMSDVAPRMCPPIPRLSRFPELNVQTYVTVGGKPLGFDLNHEPHLLFAKPVEVKAWMVRQCS